MSQSLKAFAAGFPGVFALAPAFCPWANPEAHLHAGPAAATLTLQQRPDNIAP